MLIIKLFADLLGLNSHNLGYSYKLIYDKIMIKGFVLYLLYTSLLGDIVRQYMGFHFDTVDT